MHNACQFESSKAPGKHEGLIPGPSFSDERFQRRAQSLRVEGITDSSLNGAATQKLPSPKLSQLFSQALARVSMEQSQQRGLSLKACPL